MMDLTSLQETVDGLASHERQALLAFWIELEADGPENLLLADGSRAPASGGMAAFASARIDELRGRCPVSLRGLGGLSPGEIGALYQLMDWLVNRGYADRDRGYSRGLALYCDEAKAWFSAQAVEAVRP